MQITQMLQLRDSLLSWLRPKPTQNKISKQHKPTWRMNDASNSRCSTSIYSQQGYPPSTKYGYSPSMANDDSPTLNNTPSTKNGFTPNTKHGFTPSTKIGSSSSSKNGYSPSVAASETNTANNVQRRRLCRAEEARILTHIDGLMADVSTVLSELAGYDDSLDVLGITTAICVTCHRTAEIVAKSFLIRSDAEREARVAKIKEEIKSAVSFASATAPEVATKVALITSQAIAHTAEESVTKFNTYSTSDFDQDRKMSQAVAGGIVEVAGAAYSKQCQEWLETSGSILETKRKQSEVSYQGYQAR